MLGLQVCITKSGNNFKDNVFLCLRTVTQDSNEQGAVELTRILEAEEKAQWVRLLALQTQGPEFKAPVPGKRPGIPEHIYHLTIGRWRQVGFESSPAPSLAEKGWIYKLRWPTSTAKIVKSPVSRQQGESNRGNNPALPEHVHIYTLICIYQTHTNS